MASSSETASTTLKIGSINAWLIPSIARKGCVDQAERAKLIGRFGRRKVDILAMQEIWGSQTAALETEISREKTHELVYSSWGNTLLDICKNHFQKLGALNVAFDTRKFITEAADGDGANYTTRRATGTTFSGHRKCVVES